MTSSTPTAPDQSGSFADRLWAIALLLAVGLLLRLLIVYVIVPGQGLSVDLDLFDKWAQTLAQHGPGTFYQDAESAVYSPGYMYFLWPIGVLGNAIAGIQGIPAYDATFGLLKIPAILADVVIGLLLYRAARRWFGSGAGLVAAGLYLFVPATWYESAVWGQVDAVGMAFVLAALLALVGGWSEVTVALVVFAVIIKPWYALAIVIIAPVLLHRHLFARGSGPVPEISGRLAALDLALGGWFTKRQGRERLASCAAVGFLTGVLALLPFDMWRYAPADLAGIPVVGHIAGFMQQTLVAAGQFPVLTANAFNVWALVGPIPLYSELSRTFIWPFDSLLVLGSISAGTVGTVLLGAMVALAVAVLLVRDDRTAILTSFTVLAFAFFALPTRVHERYQFPIFVVFALLVAGSTLSERRWRWWYVAVGVLQTINLHAVVTLNRPTFATPGLIGAPLGDLFRSDAVVIFVSVANTLLFGLLFVVWLRELAWPALLPVVLRIAGRTGPAAVTGRPPTAEGGAPGEPAAEPARIDRTGAEVLSGGLLQSVAGRAYRLAGPIRRRLSATTPPVDNTAALVAEPGGRLDRRDLLLMAVILVVTLGVRTYRIDTPRTMYFDELYYASTATEFLQDWRYGISTEIFEYTHPHISKYVQALSLWAFGNDRVTQGGSVGAPVRDVAFEPAYYDPAADGKYRGDRIAIATGDAILLVPHASFADRVFVPLPGVVLVAFDAARHRLYAGTDSGGLWAIDSAALEPGGGGVPTAVQVGQVPGPLNRMLVVSKDRLILGTGDGQLALLDGTDGRQLAVAAVPGLSDVVPITPGGKSRVVAAFPGGLVEFDGLTLEEVARVGLAATPRGMDLVDGSDFGWRNQDMLPIPTLYVALDSNQLEAVQIAQDGSLTPFDVFAMPGSVSQVRWDRPTNMVHVLGMTADGHPTIYVVEPHTNSVFADTPLPYVPVAWLIDAQPNTPALDRQRALAFSDSGIYLSIDTGSHARAWRLPGLIAGTLTAVLMYLLARLLFRRRSVAVLLAIVMALDSLLFIQGRIAMNDSLLAFFIVAAFTLLAALFRAPGRGLGRWLPLIGLPVVGLLLGLAFSTKWVGAYAIGGAVLLVLARTQPGRWLALGGLVVLTGLLGFQAIAGQPPNVPFPILMLALTAVAALVVARGHAIGSSAPGADDPGWVNPRHRFGLPFAYAMACLLVIPAVVYVVSYIPWTLSVTGGPQLFPGWPPGHTGQTFLDLQSQMYHYHNDLRTPHAAGSPWWAWPLALKPVWGYFDTFSDGSQAMMLITANPLLTWLGVPALAFGAWQAWRRRSMALGFVVIALCAIWLPWARIDRVAFNYHWYTIVPFFYLLLAYFLAELWEGPSRRTWSLAKVSFAVILVLPALMWLLKDPLCSLAGVGYVAPTSFQCGRSIADILPLILGWMAGASIVGWFVLGMTRPRAFVFVVLGAGGIVFLTLYPAVSAIRIPNGWPLVFQGLLPTWDISFQFNFNTYPFTAVPLLGIGPLVFTAAAAAAAWFVIRQSRRGRLSSSRRSPPTSGGGDTPVGSWDSDPRDDLEF